MGWFTLSIIGLVIIGLMQFLIAVLLKDKVSVEFLLFIISIFWFTFYGYISYKNNTLNFSNLNTNIIIALIAIGLLSVLGNMVMYTAVGKIQNSPGVQNPGIVYAIIACYIVLVAILSWIFQNQSLSIKQLAGILLCTGGIVLINI